MASDPKAPEAMEWRQEEGEEGNQGGDELSSTPAPCVETTITHIARSHSVDQAPRSPRALGFLAKFGQAPRHGRNTHGTHCLPHDRPDPKIRADSGPI